MLWIFQMVNKKINIGRANNWDTRIVDISVSRQHSAIRKEKDGFWLCDLDSKFGTLIYKFKPSLLILDEPQYVQWGRTLLIFIMEQPLCNWLSWCLRPPEIISGIKYQK